MAVWSTPVAVKNVKKGRLGKSKSNQKSVSRCQVGINKTSRCNAVYIFLTSSENHKNHQIPTVFTMFSCLGLISYSLILSRQNTSHGRQNGSKNIKSREINVKKRHLTSGSVRERHVAAQKTSRGHEIDLQTTSWDVITPQNGPQNPCAERKSSEICLSSLCQTLSDSQMS